MLIDIARRGSAVSSGPLEYISYAFTDSGGEKDFTVAKPVGTQSGDFMLAYFFHHAPSVTLTGPSGWTSLTSNNASANSAAVFYYTAGGSEPATYSFSSDDNANNGAAILTFRGGTGAVDVHGAFGTENSTTVTAPTITPTVDGLNIVFIGAEISPQDVTAKPARFTELFVDGTTPMIAAFSDEYLAASGATGNETFTLESSAGNKAIQLQIY
jgi:hypothetical protein